VHATIPRHWSLPVPRAARPKESLPVVTAYILIQTEVGKAAQIAREIMEIEGVQQAENVAGPYDVILRAEARNFDELGKLVVSRCRLWTGSPGPLPVRWSTSSAARPPSGIWPTATAKATRVDRGGRRRAAASEPPWSKTPANGAKSGKPEFEDRGDRPARA
jgi:Lrp/AsnC ligand binding domain